MTRYILWREVTLLSTGQTLRRAAFAMDLTVGAKVMGLTLSTGDIIDQQASGGATVIRTRDGAERLRPCGVPACRGTVSNHIKGKVVERCAYTAASPPCSPRVLLSASSRIPLLAVQGCVVRAGLSRELGTQTYGGVWVREETLVRQSNEQRRLSDGSVACGKARYRSRDVHADTTFTEEG